MRALLFSGGVESTCLAYQYRPDVLVTVDYGQIPAAGELRAAAFIANKLKLRHDVISVDASALGSGDLVGRDKASQSKVSESWPFRNQLLLTLAAMKYASQNLRELMIGTVVTDNVHADGTKQFIDRIESLVQCELPQVTISAPAIAETTIDLVRASKVPMELLRWAFSCHKAVVACGTCRGCSKTLDLFKQLDTVEK
ncbi:7-cyano-7-deazaguanine synthase [Sulfitobacter sp.]|uniref:7-cyano-7-deazaguanine synthase n=1 Tax=Sulfitobacter sp. TaxID=1903071 RepID=UPI003568D287